MCCVLCLVTPKRLNLLNALEANISLNCPNFICVKKIDDMLCDLKEK